MAWAYRKECGRKLVHLLSIFYVLIYVLLYKMYGHTIGILALTMLLAMFLMFEYARIGLGKDIPLVSFFWKFKRPNEKKRIGSEVYFLIGAIISLAIFDVRIAVAAILMTTFGDFVSFFASSKGRFQVPTRKWKKFEGMFIELILNILVGFLFLRTNAWFISGGFGEPVWLLICAMAVTATLVEIFVHQIDDNLLIPLSAGLVGQILLMFL